jgi:hypothetical protein
MSELTIKARPHLNGNRPEDFERHARAIYQAASKLQTALIEARAEVMHGRNYQHREPAKARVERDADVAVLNLRLEMLKEVEALAIAINGAARAEW